jgi:lipoic acid synthetase
MLREAGVDLVTIGQYLAPSDKHHSVMRFPEPEMFDKWADEAIELGFLGCASGPLVRSSYRAGRLYQQAAARLIIETE